MILVLSTCPLRGCSAVNRLASAQRMEIKRLLRTPAVAGARRRHQHLPQPLQGTANLEQSPRTAGKGADAQPDRCPEWTGPAAGQASHEVRPPPRATLACRGAF